MPIRYDANWGTAKKGRKLTRRQASQVKALISRNAETKLFYSGYGNTINSAMSMVRLTDIGLGDYSYDRNGDEVILKGLRLRYSLHTATTGLVPGTDEYNVIRVIVFQWRVSDGTSPTQAEILHPTGSDVPTQQINNEEGEKFRILYDRVHTIYTTPIYDGTNVDLTPGLGSHAYKSVRIPLKKIRKHLKFDSQTQTGVGHLYLGIVSDSTFVPHPFGDFTWEVAYKDS